MPEVAAKVWTTQRKWIGNILPALLFIPFVAWGIVWMLQKDEIYGRGLLLVAIGVAAGWIGLNFFGLFGNGFMRRELKRILTARGIDFSDPHYFVGFATPRFSSVLDAHEDIGFLFLRPDTLQFVGEQHELKVPRSEISKVRFRPNVHSWVGLGRWISVEGVQGGTRFRMNVEPRERNYLLANLLSSKCIKRAILRWKSSGPDSRNAESRATG
jgi:hypothetical protein